MSVARPSIQSLLIQMCFNGQLLATGTGFIVESRLGPVLVTNRHNVTGRNQETGEPLSDKGGIPNEIQIIHNCKNMLGTWIEKIEPLYFSNQLPRWYEHPLLGSQADFVALPLSNTDGIDVYPYDLNNPGPDIAIGPSEICSVVGFPFGLQAGVLISDLCGLQFPDYFDQSV